MEAHDSLRAAALDPAFRAAAAPYALLDTDLRIRAVNEAYLAATQRDRDSMIEAIAFGASRTTPERPRRTPCET